MMTTILWALLFFGLIGLIGFHFSAKDRIWHEEQNKKMREAKKEFLKKRNMTEEELQDMIEKWVD